MIGNLEPEEQVMSTTIPRFLIFSKESCGPCMLVKKYFNSMNDPRVSMIEEISLDLGAPEENYILAKRYTDGATPTLVVINDLEEGIEKYVGGMAITQNIRKLFNKYGV